MAWNQKLLELSRNVLEPYVGWYLKNHRNWVKSWDMAVGRDDTDNKIDLFIDTVDGKHCPVQVKTRNIDSTNYTLTSKDIIDSQENRVFAFIDKTFDEETINTMHSMPINDAKQLMINEMPKVFIGSQIEIKDGIETGIIKLKYNKDKLPYYLIPNTILTLV